MAIDTQIPDGPPQFSVHEDIQKLVPIFSYDPRTYRDGLQFAGVPNQAIDTLKTTIDSTWSNNDVKYDSVGHEIKLTLNPKFLGAFADEQEQAAAGTWDLEEGALSNAINFSLARSAKRMADIINRHPASVQLGRLEPGQSIWAQLVFSGDLLASAAVGAVLADKTGLSAIGGLTLSGFVGVGSYSIWNYFDRLQRTNRRSNSGEVEARDELLKRELDFARSDGARAIFGKVVSIG